MSAISNAVKLKSKTVNFNALFLALVAVSGACGISLEPELVAALQTLLNVILRFLTSEPLEAK